MVEEVIKYDNGTEVTIYVERGIPKYCVKYGSTCSIYNSKSSAIDYVKKLSDGIAMEKKWVANLVADWKAATADEGLAIKEV